MSDDLPIFDELCRRSLTFIAKCIFHRNSLIRFIARQGIMFSRYKSLLGSNFHFCVSRFKFSESAFLDNNIYVTLMVKNTVLICGMTIVYTCIARFMYESISLRDMVGRYGNLSLLSEDELNCIANYLATY